MSDVALFINTWLKFFFILTPFFAISIFITMTKDMANSEKRLLAMKKPDGPPEDPEKKPKRVD